MKWEHRYIRLYAPNLHNEKEIVAGLGADGWEMVTAVYLPPSEVVIWFKKPIGDHPLDQLLSQLHEINSNTIDVEQELVNIRVGPR